MPGDPAILTRLDNAVRGFRDTLDTQRVGLAYLRRVACSGEAVAGAVDSLKDRVDVLKDDLDLYKDGLDELCP